jgi:hypothetical protein
VTRKRPLGRLPVTKSKAGLLAAGRGGFSKLVDGQARAPDLEEALGALDKVARTDPELAAGLREIVDVWLRSILDWIDEQEAEVQSLPREQLRDRDLGLVRLVALRHVVQQEILPRILSIARARSDRQRVKRCVDLIRLLAQALGSIDLRMLVLGGRALIHEAGRATAGRNRQQSRHIEAELRLEKIAGYARENPLLPARDVQWKLASSAALRTRVLGPGASRPLRNGR